MFDLQPEQKRARLPEMIVIQTSLSKNCLSRMSRRCPKAGTIFHVDRHAILVWTIFETTRWPDSVFALRSILEVFLMGGQLERKRAMFTLSEIYSG